MRIAELPKNESERLAALLHYQILDTEFEQVYDELTQLASEICQTPIALISLVDGDRQWFKAKIGLDAEQTPRDLAFCAHALLEDDVFVVEDALLDDRFVDNPLVVRDPSIRFYAGAQIRTAEGHVLGTLCAIDRMPRHLSEVQLHSLQVLAKQVMSQFELRAAYQELRQQTQRLQELNVTKDKLFSIIAHDLRAPLSGILGVSELLVDDIGRRPVAENKELVQEIHDTSQQSLSLLDNLLRWSLLERGKFSYQPLQIPLLSVIEKVLRLLQSSLAKKRQHLLVNCPPELMVTGDKNMLASVLQNLLSNAIKFTPQSGEIFIGVQQKEHGVQISVKDTGIGMSKQQLSQLFNIEKNVSTHGTDGETGTGLGLVLSYQFVQIHGSTLMVESEQGKGTIFSFVLS